MTVIELRMSGTGWEAHCEEHGILTIPEARQVRRHTQRRRATPVSTTFVSGRTWSKKRQRVLETAGAHGASHHPGDWEIR